METGRSSCRFYRKSSSHENGSIEDGKLLFSVKDNGCGFDPDDCPGILQGHFGLEGIRERAGLLAGNLELESAPGAGTKATVSIVLPTADTKEQA